MKRKDLLLLAALRQNARETLTCLSKKTDIPVSTVFDRLKMHEATTIRKHTAIVDFAKLGFSTRVSIAFKVNKEDRESLRDHLLADKNINSVFKINNGYDYLAEGIFRGIKELEEFLEDTDQKFGIRNREVHYIIEDLKREDFLSDPAKIGHIIEEGFSL
jgi:DNA-binding Lrp family transcriptional regulator